MNELVVNFVCIERQPLKIMVQKRWWNGDEEEFEFHHLVQFALCILRPYNYDGSGRSFGQETIARWVKARYGVPTFGQNFSTNSMRRKEK